MSQQPITIKGQSSSGPTEFIATGVFAVEKPEPAVKTSGVVRELAK